MTYRDDLDAERARAEALEKRAEDLARENAELQAKLEHPPPPREVVAKSPRSGSRGGAWVFGVAGFISFMGAVMSTGVISGTMKLAAPIVCPKDYSRSIVVLHVGGTMKGGTSYSSDLWCAFPDKGRFPVAADTFAVVGVLFGEWLFVTMAVALIAFMLRRRRAR